MVMPGGQSGCQCKSLLRVDSTQQRCDRLAEAGSLDVLVSGVR